MIFINTTTNNGQNGQNGHLSVLSANVRQNKTDKTDMGMYIPCLVRFFVRFILRKEGVFS